MIYRDDLERVYALLEDEKRWTQGRYAADSAGEPICDEDGDEIVSPRIANYDEAACWCLWGAAYKCGIRGPQDTAFVAALGLDGACLPNDFNDSHTHAEVLQLLRAAIERAPVKP